MAGTTIGVRADGGRVLGLGHLTRCLALAEVLRSALGVICHFYLYQDDSGAALVEGRGWPVVRLDSERPEVIPTGDALLVIDMPGGVSAAYVDTIRQREQRRLIAIFDGTCDGRLGADLVISPIERMSGDDSWRGFNGRRYEGLAYAILSAEYANLPRRVVDPTLIPAVLVTMGGADPYGLTMLALEALDSMSDAFRTTVAIGPAFSSEKEVSLWVRTSRRAYQVRRERVLAPLMIESDVAVTSFGTTAYELAATGLPSIALCITPDHVKAAEVFSHVGSMISAGLYSTVTSDRLANMVGKLLRDPTRRSLMASAGQALVDGQGARRVADTLVAAIAERKSL